MASSIKASMGRTEWCMLIVLSMLWGGSFFFTGVAVLAMAPLMIVALRVAIAAIILWGVVIVLRLRIPARWEYWRAFFGMGLLNNVIPFTLIVWGQTQIASGLAAILNATTPLFAVIVAGLVLPDERATPMKLTGVVVGIVGVVVMLGLPTANSSYNLIAQFAIIAAALSYAFAGVYGRRFNAMGVSPIVVAAGQVTASALIMLPVSLATDGVLAVSLITPSVWFAILGLGILSTALAYVLYFKLLASAGATNLLLVTLLIPVSAIVLGWAFLNESLQPIHFVGMGLIALGLSAIDGRIWQTIKP